jgi:hypothetical protein
MSTGYGGITPRYQIPYITAGDVVDSASEALAANTIENQLIGLISAHSGGNGVISTGSFNGIFSAGNSRVILSGAPAFSGFISQIYTRSFSSLTWEGLPDSTVAYLYVQLVETDTQSSRVRGDVITGWNDTGVIPDNAVLVAKATTTGLAITVDSDPPDRINLYTVATHAANSVNPHGTTLQQDQIVVSGVQVLGDLTAANIQLAGDLIVSGTVVFANGLQSYGDAQFNNGIFVSGLSTFVGDAVFSGSAIFEGKAQFNEIVATSGITNYGTLQQHGNIEMAIGSLVDGRDISTDGVNLDQHIANITGNPHDVTIQQISGVSIYGGETSKLLGNLPVASGITVDGVDLSETAFLVDGSNADPFWQGGTLIRQGHTHNMSGIGYQYLDFAPEYVGTCLSGAGYGFLDVRRELNFEGNYQNAYRWRPDPVGVTSGARNSVGIWLEFMIPADMAWISGVELQVYTPVSNSQRFVNVDVYDTNGVTVPLVDNHNLQDGIVLTNKVMGIVNAPAAATWDKGKFASALIEINGQSGLNVFIGRLKMTYRTVWPAV